MLKKIDCVYNDSGAWCKNKLIKKSLCGIGTRVCLVFGGKICLLQEKRVVPKPTISPMKKRYIVVDCPKRLLILAEND